MKRQLLIISVLFFGTISFVKAQCYGKVKLDTYTSANGASSFNITTTNPNELILIAYNGWYGPGSPPVTVDGNPATQINVEHTANNACATVFCYSAAASGSHSISCSESGYSNPYFLNFAASFYAIGTCTPLSCGSIVTAGVAGNNSSSCTSSVVTTTPNEMIFDSFVYNTGISNAFSINPTNATLLNTLHVGNGIDACDGYTNAPNPGTYTVSTNDPNACCGGNIVLAAIVPPLCGGGVLTYTDSQTNPTCNNSNGTATVTPTSGNGPYTYLWSPGGYTTQTVTGLSSGSYTVTVRDVSCDTVAVTVVLVSGSPVASAAQIGNIKCNGDLAGADASVNGGTGPYTYGWSPSGGNKDTAKNLSAGTYTITVTDHLGCISTSSVTITQPPALALSKTQKNILCFGGSTGSATATVSGGTGAYTYSWSPSGGNGATANNLSAGTYICTITDANGCTRHDTAVITQPAVLKDTVTTIGSTCNGANGSANTTASGGTPSYTYKWSPSGGTKATASNLSAGTYTVTLTDANGCSKTTSVTIGFAGAPSATSTKVDLSCNSGSNGSITANVTGGTSPYTYAWSPSGGTNATASGLTVGTYTCTITDAIGCVIEDTVTISQPPAITATFNNVNSTCDDANGSATVTATGGTGAYTYLWSPTGSTNATVSNLSAGTYSCTVTDANGCVSTTTTVVSNVGSVPLVNLCCDTTIAPGDSTVLSTTGSGGVNYSWAPPDGLSCTTCPDPVGSPSVTTTYTETVSDANGCTKVITVTVTIEIPCSDFNVPNVFTPNDDGINDDFVVKVENPSSFNLTIFDRWGKQVYSSADATKYWNGRYNNTDYLVPDGVYYYFLKATCGTNSYSKKGYVQVMGRSK